MKAAAALILLLNCLSRCHGWSCSPGPPLRGAAQIDAGQGQVVARNNEEEVFLLSGSTWTRLGSVALKHVSVGAAGIWGVDHSNAVYKYGGGDFLRSTGQSLQQVDAGGQDQVVGVTSSSTIHCLSVAAAAAFRRGGSTSWKTFNGRLMYFSCSSLGCWGVNSGHSIYFTKADSCQDVQWTHVPGAAIKAEVGADGTVFVVNANGNLYQRSGISDGVPHGTEWFQVPLSETVKHASYDLGNLWLVVSGGVVMKCTQQGWDCSPGPQHAGAAQIEAGQGQVLMTTKEEGVFFLSASTWTRLGSVPIKQVSVGPAGIFGMDSSGIVYKYVVDDFIPLNGQEVIQVEAGGEGQVVGIGSGVSSYCVARNIASAFNRVGFPDWTTIDLNLGFISCNSPGCWAVTPTMEVFFIKMMADSCDVALPTVIAASGGPVMIDASADGSVFTMDAEGRLHERTGVSPEVPVGTGWALIPLDKKMKHISSDQGVLWGIDDKGTILKCTK